MPKTPSSLMIGMKDLVNQECWDRFVRDYTALLYYWARKNGARDPDDLVQVVFTRVFRAMPNFKYDKSRSFRAWLKAILMNELRKWPPKVEQFKGDVPISDPAIELENEESRQFLLTRILVLIQRDFAETTWKSFWETAVEGRSAEEVARELNISINSAYVNRARVLARLRDELGDLFDCVD